MTKLNQNIIACVAGHSGGHIVPCLTLAKNQHPDQLIFFSSTSALDQKILASSKEIQQHIPLPVHPARRWYRVPVQLLQMITGFFRSLFYLHKKKPHKIISTGGLVAVPVCLAAWILRIPIELYELNAVPGKAIKLLAPFASTIHICFANARTYFNASKCNQFSYPIRFKVEDFVKKDEVIHELNLSLHKKTILVLGGSQGSQFINKTVAHILEAYPELATHIQIIHQLGNADQRDYQAHYARLGIPSFIFAFDSNLARYYALADLVIARAGAGTIFETLHFKTPCILIPLEIKMTDHQLDNAQAIAGQYPAQFTMMRQREIEHNNAILAQTIMKQLGHHTTKEITHETPSTSFNCFD